jgi:hypothetical protein
MKWRKKLVFFLLHMAALNSSILLKTFNTNQNQKGKGYAFRDFILDCVEKMRATRERRQDR